MKGILKYILVLLFSPSFSQTIHLGANYSINSTYLLNKNVTFSGDDSTYIHSVGQGVGLSGAFYFAHGGYYHSRIYGIKTELNLSSHNQNYKVYPGIGLAKPDSFYSFKTSLRYTDIPVLFSFCPNHHQGLVFELGPQISILRKTIISAEDSKPSSSNYEKFIPPEDIKNYNKVMYSAILGMGLFYNVTEKFAVAGVFRIAAGLSDVMKRNPSDMKYSPSNRFAFGLNVQAFYKFNSYFAKKNKGL